MPEATKPPTLIWDDLPSDATESSEQRKVYLLRMIDWVKEHPELFPAFRRSI